MARVTTFKYTVTVVSSGGNKYAIDGNTQQYVILFPGCTYEFNQDDSSNGTHPLRFSETSDGTHNSGSEYTTGVTTSGTPGSATAFTKIEVTSSTPQRLYYYCSSHSGMGGEVNIPDNFTNNGDDSIYYGGINPSAVNTIDISSFSSEGDATDFGDATNTTYGGASVCSTTRVLVGGGVVGPALTDDIRRMILSSKGNSFTFSNLTQSRRALGGAQNKTRGIFAGGYEPTFYNVIDFITTATTGDATDFGDLTNSRLGTLGVSSPSRAVFGGGGTPSNVNTIDYVTIATTGNASDFGDLTTATNFECHSGASSSTRGIFAGGSTPSKVNTIEYVTIGSTGNATDFGDLTTGKSGTFQTSNNTKCFIAGGATPSEVNTIEKITIASTGNATDIADLTQARQQGTGASNSNGGLQ